MKVNINAKTVQQQIIAEKVQIDQSGNIRKANADQGEKELLNVSDKNVTHDGSLDSLKKNVRQKIGNGKIEDAFDDLKNANLKENLNQEVLLIAGKYSLLKSDRTKGIIKFDEYQTQLSRIIEAVLSFINELP